MITTESDDTYKDGKHDQDDEGDQDVKKARTAGAINVPSIACLRECRYQRRHLHPWKAQRTTPGRIFSP